MKIKPTIMVADDDPGIVDSIKIMLEEFDFDVETTLNGNTVRNLKNTIPDLILLDLWMSGIDGRDICKHLKSQDLTKHIPIIIVSANRDTEQIAQKCGADDFLAKPFDMTVMIEKINTLLKNSSL